MYRPFVLMIFVFTTLLALFSLAGCSPTFDWREVRPDNTRLVVLLPCKPDKAQKQVPMGGQPTQLSMLGCDAGGATFAVAVAEIADASGAAALLAQWQALTLANMQAVPGSAQPLALRVPGASAGLLVVRLQASGRRTDGASVSGQAAYFAQGKQLFQVVLYAPKIAPEAADTFFSSLKFE